MKEYKTPEEISKYGMPLISSSYHISKDRKSLILPVYFPDSDDFMLACIPKKELKIVKCDKEGWGTAEVRGKEYMITADAMLTFGITKCLRKR